MSDKAITKLIKETDLNGDGSIDINEFFNMVENGMKGDVIHRALILRSGVRKAFEKYDKDGNGFITRDEFKKIVEDKYQATLTPTQVDALMNQADVNKSGKLSLKNS